MTENINITMQSISPDELVTLVKNDEVDIHSISIAILIQKWIEAIEDRESLDNFFTLFNAVTILMSIKLLTLLPTVGERDESDEIQRDSDEEVDRNWVYSLRDELREKEIYASRLFSRPLISQENMLELINPDALYKLADEVIARYREKPNIEWQKEEIDIKAKRREIEKEIKESGRLNLRTILERENSLLKVIITFIIVLELCKQTKIKLLQRRAFGAIWVVWKHV